MVSEGEPVSRPPRPPHCSSDVNAFSRSSGVGLPSRTWTWMWTWKTGGRRRWCERWGVGRPGRTSSISVVHTTLDSRTRNPRPRPVAPVATPDGSFPSFFPLVSRLLFLSRDSSRLYENVENTLEERGWNGLLSLVRLGLGLDFFLISRSLDSRIMLHKWAVTE